MLNLTIEQVSKHLKDGIISAPELLNLCLKRAKETEKFNAFVTLLSDRSQKSAEESKSRFKKNESKGVLDGVPVAVKDNFCTRGVRTTCSSRMLLDFVPTYSATVVQRLEQSGANIMGKTNLDEFAMGCGTVDSVHGATLNPWSCDTESSARVAGGSSGGSAASVASGAVFAALGSDSGGSTRNPASYCGVIGYKPTYSSVSRHGLIPLVNSMDVPGIITRSVRDAAFVYNALCGFDSKDSTTVEGVEPMKIPVKRSVEGLRIGIPIEYHCEGLDERVLETWNQVAKLLSSNGATVKQVSVKHTEYSLAVYSVLNQCEVASNMCRYDGLKYGYRHMESQTSTNEMFAKTRSIGFNRAVRARILAGNYFLLNRNYEKYFVKAMKVRRIICEELKEAWKQVDVLLTPTTLGPAPLLNDFLQLDNRAQCSTNDFCTQSANMAGCPAISIPIELSNDGLPLSLQLMGPNYQDEHLLSVAHWIEQQVNFPYLKFHETQKSTFY